MTVSGWNSPRERERVHGHLGPVYDLLDEATPLRDSSIAAAIAPEAPPPTGRASGPLTLAVGRLDDGRHRAALLGLARELPAWLRNARLGEELTLPQLRDRERGRAGESGCGSPILFGHARGDRHRPVDPGGDDAFHALGACEALDALLVLGGDDRPPVRVPEPGRRGIAVERDHEQAPLAGRREQAELRRPGP